jgi:Carbohydrate esterase, sialic acid-specific acetylesterase
MLGVRVRFRFPLAVVCLSLLAAVFAAAESSGTSLPTPVQVFVLAGQSNMLGRGMPISTGAPSDPRLLVWRKDGWHVAVDPLGDPTNKANGVGPGMTFGLGAIKDLDPQTVGLVQCAVSGTTISKWSPPHSVFTNCISQVRSAGGHIDGILFLQGESDASNKDDASNWAERFRIVLTAFRTDLGTGIPMVIGQIGRLSGFPYQQTVRDQQAKAASSNPGVSMITTLDLKMGSDGVHFTVGSYKTIGTRFATAWWALRRILRPRDLTASSLRS